MNEWPLALSRLTHELVISSASPNSVGTFCGNNGFGSAAWPANNRAIYIPFRLAVPAIAQKIFVSNGAAATGNADVGIYDSAGTRLVSVGSTARAGTDAINTFDIADTLLGPGQFYMAIVLSTTSGSVYRNNAPGAGLTACKVAGMAQEALGATTLPATATFATCASAYFPLMAVAFRVTV